MPLELNKPAVSATADLGEVTFDLTLDTTAASTGANVNVQLFLMRKNDNGFHEVVPRDKDGAPVVFAVMPGGARNRHRVTVRVPKGQYGGGKCALFNTGSNFSGFLTDFGFADLNLSVVADQARVKAPVLEVGPARKAPAAAAASATAAAAPVDPNSPAARGTWEVPYRIKYPAGQHSDGTEFWVQAKGSGGFDQERHWMSQGKPGGDPLDDYRVIEGVFQVSPYEDGIVNVQFGLYNGGWQQLSWLWPGVDYETRPDWVVKAPADALPSVADALKPQGKCPFAVGGNYGNFICTGSPHPRSVDYFRLLRAATGVRVLRQNVDPDQWLDSGTYRNLADSVHQNMMAAGIVPVIAAQFLPKGGGVGTATAARVARLEEFCRSVARFYKDRAGAVIHGLLNEPHEVGAAWSAWKPVLERLGRAVKAEAPGMTVWGDLHHWSKDGSGIGTDLPDRAAVDALGWHPYIHAGQLAAQAPPRGFPYVVEEYHDGSREWHQALLDLPEAPIAVMGWAYTIKGQDQIPLVGKVEGAVLELTDVGAGMVSIYDALKQTGKLPAAPAAPAPGSGVSQPGSGASGGGAVPLPPPAADPELLQRLSNAEKDAAAGREKDAAQDALDAAQEGRLADLERRVVALEARGPVAPGTTPPAGGVSPSKKNELMQLHADLLAAIPENGKAARERREALRRRIEEVTRTL